MAWDEIKFKISADMDFGDAIDQVLSIKKGIGSLKEDIAEMPNLTGLFNSSLSKTTSVIDSLSNKLEKYARGDFKSNEERTALENSINQDILEINTMRSLQGNNGSFGVSMARSWFGDLPSAVKQELDSVMPKVANIIRTKTGSLVDKGYGYSSRTRTGIAAEAWKDPEIQAIVSNLKLAQSKAELKQSLVDIVPHSMSTARLNEYQLKRYGSVLQDEKTALDKGDILDLFPKSYREAYKNKGYVKRTFSEQQAKEVLSKDAVDELNMMLEQRPIMAKAAISSGISRRDARGVLETKKEITRDDWESYRAALYDELVNRVAGYGKGKLDPYSSMPKDIEKLTSRLTSSTSGTTMTGMHDIEKYEDNSQWTTATGNKNYTKLRGEGRRAMDEYVVTKYSPFLKNSKGEEVAPKEVMINESHNTRLLGQGKWKNNDDVSDTVALISLAGYDPNNKEQEAQLLDIYKNGRVINGKQFIAQSTHGKGDDQVIRMIEKSAFDRVEQQEGEWARTRKIQGSYWRGYEDKEIERKIADGSITAQDWGKHLEMQNKAWTPTTDVGLDLSDKRIAVVDFKKAGDGATWAPKSMMPDSGQIRMGVGGKGSVFVYDDEVIGADGKVVKRGLAGFGEKTGIADDQGRVMMPGPDGKMYDVSGYDMIMPLDAIKNLGAYKDENGNFVSGERASEIATALGRRYGIGMLANYSKEDTSSRHIGSQMASFISLSPALREYQIQKGMERLEALDTETGQLKYVFGDQNDWLSRQVNADPQLLRTQAAMRRVDQHRQSLMQQIIGGEYNDFGEGDSGISDMRLAASPLTSLLLANGEIPKSVIEKARGYIEADAKKRGIETPQYTDEQIKNMIIPDQNTVLDFAHKDQAQVAVIRSPTGYGNMVHATNLAAQAEPIYRGFGISTNAGIYVSDKDLKVLQGADYDSDEAKVIYNEELRKSVEESLKTQHYEEQKINSTPIAYTPEQLSDMSVQSVLRAGRAATMNLGMGTGSAGIRIMQLDLSKPSNKKFIQQAQRLAAYYDNRTVYDKNAQEMDLTDVDAWPTLRLGKEYTKFSDKVQDLFAFEDDLLGADDRPIEDSKYVFTAKNGKKVNLRRLQDMGVDNINLPAVFMANHLAGVMTIGEMYRKGAVDTSNMDAVAEAMDAMGYGDAGPARKRLMQTMRQMLPQFGTGERTMLTPAETRALSAMADAAELELKEDSKQYLNPATGRYEYNNNSYKSLDALVSAREKDYSIRTARNAVNSFGITEERLRGIYGEDYKKYYKNATPSTIELLPEDKEELVYQEQAESLAQQIEEAKENVEKENKAHVKLSSKQKKKIAQRRTVEQQLIDKEIENQAAVLGITDNNKIDEMIDTAKRAVEADQVLADLANEPETKFAPEQIKGANSALAASTAKLEGLQNYKSLLTKRENLASGKTENQLKLDDLLKQQQELELARAENLKAIDMRTEYQALLSNANEYGNMLWGYQKGKENKINDTKSYAEKYWGRSYYQSLEQMKPLDDFEAKVQESSLNEPLKNEMLQGLSQAREKINENMQKDFTNKAILFAKQTSDQIEEELNIQQNAPTAQKRKLDQYDQSIQNARSFTSFMQKQLSDGKVDAAYQKLYEDAINDANKYIESAESAKAKLVAEYTKQNEQHGRLAVEGLQIKQGLKSKNSLAVKSETRKAEIQSVRNTIDKQYKEGNYTKEEYDKVSGQLDQLEKRANPGMIALTETFGTLKKQAQATSSYILNMFSRRLFQSALQEVKKFVREFNQQMTTIQMITFKSDEEMSKLGSGLIDKAKELKISVSEISQSAATLYRQGLSDEEVNERLDVISKFSKVSGTKVDAATKLITIAMNTGLVSDPQTAADVVTALGDNAATNAAQIEKGIEKAGAAAAADGTTFAELASMLTAITSTTQIGGSVAGRTLNTIFGRMNKIGTNELIYDENGHAISGSAVASLLEEQGIKQYDEQGNKRSSYDVLYELSQKWDNLKPAEQQQLATAIAGTRQYSNFAAIMQGMAEGKVDEYMKLAGESSGITDKKFDIYTKSLEASLTDLRNTFDKLIADMTDTGALTGLINTFTKMIQGVDNLNNSFGGLGGTLAAVLPMLISLALIKSGIASGHLGMAAVGAVGAIASGAILDSIGSQQTAQQKNVAYEKSVQERISSFDDVDRLKTLRKQRNRTDEENSEYASLINRYARETGLINTESGAATYSIENLTKALSDLSGEADKAADSVIKEADKKEKEALASQIAYTKGDTVTEFEQRMSTGVAEKNHTLSAGNTLFNVADKGIWTYDEETKQYKLNENALENQKRLVNNSKTPEELFGVIGVANDFLTGKHATSWTKDVRQPLIDFYYGAAQAGVLGEDAKKLTVDEWGSKIYHNEITQDQLEKAFAYNFGGIDGVSNNRYLTNVEVAKDIFSRKLSGFGYSSDQIDYLARSFALDVNKGTSFGDAYSKIVGTGVTYDDIKASVDESLKGYRSEKQTPLEKLGLEDVGSTGYFIDEDNGNKPISQKAAMQRVNDYNTKRSNETKGYEIRDTETGNTIAIYNEGYTTAEADKKAKEAIEAGFYYFIDSDGKRRYYNSEQERDNAKEEYEENEANWEASYIDYNYPGLYRKFKGNTKEEALQLATESRDLAASTAFDVRFGKGGSSIEGLRFGNAEDAQAYADELNIAEQQRYQRELREAQEEQIKNTEYSYTDITGQVHSAKGPEGLKALQDMRLSEVNENPYVLLDEYGRFAGSFQSKSEANDALFEMTRFYSGNFEYGYGREGYEAYKKAQEESKEYYAGDFRLGYGEEGKAAAQKMIDERYAYKDRYGNTVNGFANPEEAEEARLKAIKELQASMESEIEYNLNNPISGSFNRSLGEDVVRRSVEKKYQQWFDNLNESVYDTLPEMRTEDIPIELEQTIFGSVHTAEEVASAIEANIPDLKDIDPAKVAKVYGQLPTSIKMMLDEAIKVGKVTVEQTENINKALAEATEPRLKAVYNRFNEGSKTSYNAWMTDSKNSIALLADQATASLLGSGALDQANKQLGLQMLVDEVNFKDNKQWQSLVQQSPEFGRILDQVQLDSTGRVVSAPDDILNQISTWLFKNGRDYGELPTTLSEKARQAATAFTGLTENGWYTSYEARNNALNDEYNKAIVQPFEDKWAVKLEKAKNKGDAEYARQEQLYERNKARLTTIDQYAESKFGDVHYLSDLDQAYLTEILGSELATRVKSDNATTEELALGTTLLNNAQYGVSGLTARDKLAGINRVLNSGMVIGDKEGQFRTSVAAKYFEGWGDFNAYAALTQAKAKYEETGAAEDLKAFEDLGGQDYLDTLSQSLANFQKNSALKVEVEGIQQLEEAGKVAEGTAAKLEKLQKGGTISLEVEMSMKTEAFEQAQANAKLNSSNISEQDEAAMAVLGMSREQYYSNRNANLELAKQVQNARNSVNGASWEELYNAEGLTDEQREAIDLAAHAAGYYATETGVYYDGSGRHSQRSYTYGNKPGDVEHVGEFVGTERQYTDLELANARARIVNGSLSAKTDYALYSAAVGGLGTYGRQVQWNRENNVESSEELLRLAEQEAKSSQEKAKEAEDLLKSETSSTSFGGMFAYQQLQRQQQNKGAYAAERLFTSLNDKTVNNFDDLLDVVGSADANDWKDFIESSSDLSNKLADMGVKIGEDGFDFSDLKKNGYEAADVLNVLKEAASEASNGLKGFKEVLTTGQETARAEEFIGGEVTDENYEAFEAFIGNNEVAQIAKNYAVQYKADKQLYDEYQGLTNTSDRAAWLINHNNKEPTNPGEFDLFGQYEGYNRDYVEALYDNALLGKQGLTDADRLRMFEGIMNDVGQGASVEQIRKSNNTGFYSDVLSGVNGGEDYLQMIEILNGKGLDFKQFKGIEETSDEFQQLQAAFEGTDYSANQFLLTSEEIDNELRSNAISTYKLFGKETEKVNAIYKKLNGTVEEQLEARKEMTRHKLDLSNATYYTSGKGAGNYKKVAKDFLEYSDKDIKALESQLGKEGAKIEIQKQAELKFEFSQQQIQNDLNAIIQDTITDLGSDFNVDALNLNLNGTYDVSQLRALAAEATGQTKAILDSILAELAGMEGQVTFQATTDGKSIKIASSNLKSVGGGKPTGSGGGGGGKTATDKLLEQQKHRISQIEHEGKILEIYGKGYDFLNDYDAQMKNVDDQIANQEKLRAAYEQNIAEMQAQLAVVERGSDDWFKLAEAINSAREALAGIRNTINDLNSQKIQILEQKVEHDKGPNTHKSNILEKFAQRYQITDRYEAYAAAQKNMLDATGKRIDINKDAIEHWKSMLKKAVKESDAWYEIRDKIWALQEENEQLQTDIVSAKIELDQAKADQMAKDIQDSLAANQHQSDVLGIYLDAFQTTNQFDKYRNALTTIGSNLQLKKAAQDSLIEDLRAQADAKKQEIAEAEGADKRDEDKIAILKKQFEVYVNAVREAELEAAQTDVDMLTNRKAIEESFITEIEKRHEPEEKGLEHQRKMLELYARNYQTQKNYYRQEEALNRGAEVTSRQLELENEKLQDFIDLQNSGQITEGSQEWYALQDSIYAATEAVLELESAMNDLDQLKFDHIVEMFKEGTADLYSTVVGTKKFFGSDNEDIRSQITEYLTEKQTEYNNTQTMFDELITNKNADIDKIISDYETPIAEAEAAKNAAEKKVQPLVDAQAALDKFDADKAAALAKAEADRDAAKKTIDETEGLSKAEKKKKKAAEDKKYEAEKKKINKEYSSKKRKKLVDEKNKYKDLESFLPDKDATAERLNEITAERDYLIGIEQERLSGIESNKKSTLKSQTNALSEFSDYFKKDANGNIDYSTAEIDTDAINNIVADQIETALIGTDQLQHERNLIGYQQTKYQNRGELTNVGRMLEYDHDVMEKMYDETETQITAWKEYAETVRDNPEMFAKATDKIREQEEVLAKLTVELEKNTDAQEKNTEAIRQARIKAENELDKAIRAIIQKQRNMLSATVQIQNAILDTIRNSYREQWDQSRSLPIELLEHPKAC